MLDFAPGSIDYVIVTHAHIDHTGRIPLLEKQGFHGRIVTTRLTGQLMSIMPGTRPTSRSPTPSGRTRRAAGRAARRWSPSTPWPTPSTPWSW